jgi:predicted nucleic acid-binding protein
MGQALNYVLDACTLIALLKREAGWDVVDALFKRARAGGITLYMNIINLLEVVYGFRRDKGAAYAVEVLENVHASSIRIIDTVSPPVFDEAARLKAIYKRMSVADAVGIATAENLDAAFVTSDHHELDIVEAKEAINFYWFR